VDELALIQAAQHGDVDSFNTLVLAYQTRAYNLAYRLISEPDAAADATQEAFIAAYNNLRQFRGGSFKAWLMRIVTNACYDELRRRKRRPVISTEELENDGSDGHLVSEPEGSPEHIVDQHALGQAIQDCLDGLNADYRLVTVLSDIQGYEYREIAEIARVSLGTVKSRLSRARQHLRDCLQGVGELLPDMYRLNDQGDD
jgi:RNA polymerase sigma-70 factor (ECF subfamily)